VNIPKAYRRFPEASFSVPAMPDGVRVVRCDHDWGPATKVLPTMIDHAGTRQPIVYCDDDHVFHRNWLKNMVAESRRHPDQCIANAGWDLDKLGLHVRRTGDAPPRAVLMHSLWDVPYRFQRIRQKRLERKAGRMLPKPNRTWKFWRPGAVDIMEGFGGVLVKPDFFPPQVFDIPDRIWAVDDIWLSGMVALNGGTIRGFNGHLPMAQEHAPDGSLDALDHALGTATIDGLNRREANMECVRYLQAHYGVWQEEPVFPVVSSL